MTTNHPEGHIADLCARMRSFIDNQVIPAEPVLAREDDDARKALDQLRTQAKELGLWALGHPADVGGVVCGSSISYTSTKSSAGPSSGSSPSGPCPCRTP